MGPNSAPAQQHAECAPRFEYREGNLDRVREGLPGPLRRLRTFASHWHSLSHLVSAVHISSHIRERPRFIFNELLHRDGVHAYTLRDAGIKVHVRHARDAVDVWTLNEIFHLGLYDPPDQAEAVLAQCERPFRVADVGANIGIFGCWWLDSYPDSFVLAFEPDPANLPIHRMTVAANPRRDWELLAAAAATSAGTLRFLPESSTESHVTDKEGPGVISVEAVDVFPLLEGVDLLKMDIEGGEWPILADERFQGPPLLVLEYHPTGCPTDDPHGHVDELLQRAGYEIVPIYRGSDGHGMLWGIRL